MGRPRSAVELRACTTAITTAAEFRLRPKPSACNSAICSWSETVLYRFTGGTSDGAIPLAGLAFDRADNLYGTTFEGGNNTAACINTNYMCGAVFEMSPAGGGWTESLIYRLNGQSDGSNPSTAVTLDASGNVFGTTEYNGDVDHGTVFELTYSGSAWNQSTLTDFADPYASYIRGDLSWDAAGNLYGTSEFGGNGGGTVYELSPAGGTWSYSQIYGLTGEVEQAGPLGGVVRDSAGNLYGTAFSLGPGNVGLVFELSPGLGGWSYTVLHTFTDLDGDGGLPMGNLVLDAQGNLYGTASVGGNYDRGIVWKISW